MQMGQRKDCDVIDQDALNVASALWGMTREMEASLAEYARRQDDISTDGFRVLLEFLKCYDIMSALDLVKRTRLGIDSMRTCLSELHELGLITFIFPEMASDPRTIVLTESGKTYIKCKLPQYCAFMASICKALTPFESKTLLKLHHKLNGAAQTRLKKLSVINTPTT